MKNQIRSNNRKIPFFEKDEETKKLAFIGGTTIF